MIVISVVGTILVIIGIITELVHYSKRGSSGYYDSNHFAHFEGLIGYRGCSGPAFDIALDIVERQIQDSVLKERPGGQTVSIVFAFIEAMVLAMLIFQWIRVIKKVMAKIVVLT